MKPLIDKNSFLILLSLVVISMAWRPYLFGFYSDDYNIILEPISNAYSSHELISYLFNLYGNRPLSAVNAYVLITFCIVISNTIWISTNILTKYFALT